MKKRICVLAAAVCLTAALTACGQKASAETGSTQKTEASQEDTRPHVETLPYTEAESQEQSAAGGYEDNFAVDSEAAAEFGREIKAAVAGKDLEALADLASYPLYMGFADGSVSVESREDFIALGADRVFTAEMVEAMAAADETGLNPSMAGFSLTKDGKPNITFGVTDGKLTVKGMNY